MEGNLTLKRYKKNTNNPTSSECGKSFETTLTLKRHLLAIHKRDPGFVCDICSKTCSSQSNLNYHQGSCRRNKNNCYSISCPRCPAKCNSKKSYNIHKKEFHNAPLKLHKCAICFVEDERKALITHYLESHKINIKQSLHKFKSMKEFHCWMKLYEHKTNSKYIQSSSKMQNINVKHTVYSCANLLNRVSNSKKDKSKIVEYLCPSTVNIKIRGDKEVTVNVIETHLGHSTEVAPSSDDVNSSDNSTSETIDKKRKLPDDNPILDDTDLKDAFDLCTNMDSCDDSLAVDLWIEDLKLSNSVLFNKAEGCLFEGFDELKLDDSVLIIMTSLQAKILQKYPSNTIYIDWYHTINIYLATILITDDKDEVFPCGFLIASEINKSILKVFLQHVKFKIGMQMRPNVLMTNLDNCFSLEAWIEVMGMPDLVWTCPWYVQEDWRRWLNVSFIPYENKEATYQKLLILLDETDQNLFRKQLSNVYTYLLNFKHLHPFANHFKNNMKVNFIPDPMRWRECNSKITQKSKINFENMHKTLKSALWMGQKVNNRVDRTVGTIMRLVRDKSVNLISEDSEEELQNIKELISVNHEKSLEIDLRFVIKAENGGWNVLSSDPRKCYKVKKVKDQCKCEVRCEKCDSCLHQYVCSCVDASFSYNICKHIHLCCRKSSLNESPENEMAFLDDEVADACNAEKNMYYETVDSLSENSSFHEDVHSLADQDQDYYMTPHEEDREKIFKDFQNIVDSASPKKLLAIERRIEALKGQLSNVKNVNAE